MIFDRPHLERLIVQRLRACSFDELRVLARVLDGIERGREQYGPLDIERDVRDWRREGADEMRDWLFYCAAHEVAAEYDERERRTDRQRAEIEQGLDEMREVEPEQSIAIPRTPCTDRLALCGCSHPKALHEYEALHCLIGACGCTVYEGAR